MKAARRRVDLGSANYGKGQNLEFHNYFHSMTAIVWHVLDQKLKQKKGEEITLMTSVFQIFGEKTTKCSFHKKNSEFKIGENLVAANCQCLLLHGSVLHFPKLSNVEILYCLIARQDTIWCLKLSNQ